jgi:hypothetical protein
MLSFTSGGTQAGTMQPVSSTALVAASASMPGADEAAAVAAIKEAAAAALGGSSADVSVTAGGIVVQKGYFGRPERMVPKEVPQAPQHLAMDPQQAIHAAVAEFQARFAAGGLGAGAGAAAASTGEAGGGGAPLLKLNAAAAHHLVSAHLGPVLPAPPQPLRLVSAIPGAVAAAAAAAAAAAVAGRAVGPAEQREVVRVAQREKAEREVHMERERAAASAANDAAERRAAMAARFAERSAIADLPLATIAPPRRFTKGRSAAGAGEGLEDDDNDEDFEDGDASSSAAAAVAAAEAMIENTPVVMTAGGTADAAATVAACGADRIPVGVPSASAAASALRPGAPMLTAPLDAGTEREMAARAQLGLGQRSIPKAEEGVATSVSYEKAPPPHLWPPGLKRWVEKCFAGCRTSLERAAMQKQVKACVDEAASRGEFHTKDWEREPLPKRDTSHDRKRERLYGETPTFLEKERADKERSDKERGDDKERERRDERYRRDEHVHERRDERRDRRDDYGDRRGGDYGNRRDDWRGRERDPRERDRDRRDRRY